MQKKTKRTYSLAALLLALTLLFSGCTAPAVSDPVGSNSYDGTSVESEITESEDVEEPEPTQEGAESNSASDSYDISSIPEYDGTAYVVLNDNVPGFSEDDLTSESFESYSELDSLGRCGVAFANIGVDLMPTEDRDSISSVRPTGWQTFEYDIVDGGYLYNRCHLIGFQLTGENANEQNLITGTRYLNVDGMLPFENMVADYITETENHVLYRVTPIFEGDNLVASGVQMEALSVEDDGEGIEFNVYCYNVQPGIEIDYATGDSWLAEDGSVEGTESNVEADYVLNTNSMRFHLPSCSSVDQMSEQNRQDFHGTRESLIEQGYEPCGNCNP